MLLGTLGYCLVHRRRSNMVIWYPGSNVRDIKFKNKISTIATKNCFAYRVFLFQVSIYQLLAFIVDVLCILDVMMVLPYTISRKGFKGCSKTTTGPPRHDRKWCHLFKNKCFIGIYYFSKLKDRIFNRC